MSSMTQITVRFFTSFLPITFMTYIHSEAIAYVIRPIKLIHPRSQFGNVKRVSYCFSSSPIAFQLLLSQPSPNNIFQFFSHVGCRLVLPYPALPYSFHIPTLSLYTVSSHRAVLPVSLHHSAISLSSSRHLSHSLYLSLTHIHTHSLLSLLPSQVSFLTYLFICIWVRLIVWPRIR